MDHCYCAIGDRNDDNKECYVIVKIIPWNNWKDYHPITGTTFNVHNKDAFYEYGYNNFVSALITNTNVQSIHGLPVNLAAQFASVHMYDRNAPTTNVNQYAEPLLKFIQESPSLRHVTLDETMAHAHLEDEAAAQYDDNGAFLRQIVEAIVNNKHIESVDVDDINCIPPQVLASFLVPSSCGGNIKCLSVRIWDFDRAAADDSCMDLVLRAFGTNQTLETLSLFHHCTGTEADIVALVLLALSRHPKIRVLKLYPIAGFCRHDFLMTALGFFVSRTPSLEHLQLRKYSFVLEHMTILLENLSAAKLTTILCEIDVPSRMKLASYTRASSSSLKELALGLDIPQGHSMFPDYQDILIGSSLRVLDLTVANSINVGELFTALAASTNRLPCLYLGSIRDTDWRDISFHLPSLIYLRELRVESVPTGMEAITYFISTMRQNGSLHRLFLTTSDMIIIKSDHRNSLDDESEIQLLKLVCTRNRLLTNLLLTQCEERSKDGSSSSPLSLHLERSRRRSLIPSLLHSATTIPRTGPNIILMGLLCCNVSVGLGNGRKRFRTSMR